MEGLLSTGPTPSSSFNITADLFIFAKFPLAETEKDPRCCNILYILHVKVFKINVISIFLENYPVSVGRHLLSPPAPPPSCPWNQEAAAGVLERFRSPGKIPLKTQEHTRTLERGG